MLLSRRAGRGCEPCSPCAPAGSGKYVDAGDRLSLGYEPSSSIVKSIIEPGSVLASETTSGVHSVPRCAPFGGLTSTTTSSLPVVGGILDSTTPRSASLHKRVPPTSTSAVLADACVLARTYRWLGSGALSVASNPLADGLSPRAESRARRRALDGTSTVEVAFVGGASGADLPPPEPSLAPLDEAAEPHPARPTASAGTARNRAADLADPPWNTSTSQP